MLSNKSISYGSLSHRHRRERCSRSPTHGGVPRPKVELWAHRRPLRPSQIARFSGIQARGIEIVVGSFLEAKSYAGEPTHYTHRDYITNPDAGAGFDVVISLAGNAALKLQPGMVEAAIAGGARHFISSEFGADIAQNGIWKNRYFREKVVTRDHPRARQGYPGLPLHAYPVGCGGGVHRV
jgi:hypothetical protein